MVRPVRRRLENIEDEVDDIDLTELTATPSEINAVADVSGRIVSLDGTTLTATAALHGGRIVRLDHTEATSTVTLPAATGSGTQFTFIVGEVNTNSHIIKVANATDVIAGVAMMATDGGDGESGFETAATTDTITLNGTTTGGKVGDKIIITDLKAGVYAVCGFLIGTGTEATPFSATVS